MSRKPDRTFLVNRPHPLAALIALIVFLFFPVTPVGAQSADQSSDSPSNPPVSVCASSGCYFPETRLFQSLFADPREPRFFASIYDYDSFVDDFTMAAVGYGEQFGVIRWGDPTAGSSVQLGLSAGIFSQFNLDAPSNDLVNTDFTLGVPLEYRNGPVSTSVRLYHQSSHLGDEFLLRANPDRINLSFESFEYLASYDVSDLRLYAGGEYLIHRIPKSLDRTSFKSGLEYRGHRSLGDFGSLIGGIHHTTYSEHNWAPNVSVKIGAELHRAEGSRRHVRLVLEGYEGHSPFGQFYKDRISFYGFGIHLGF